MARVKRFLQAPEVGTFLILVVLAIFLQWRNPLFLSGANIATLLRAIALPGFVAIGMTICLINGQIDLSVGAQVGLSACIAAYAVSRLSWPIWLGISSAILVGGLVGLVNSLVILKLKITAFVATIGMAYILRGLANWLTQGLAIYPIPPALSHLGSAQPLGLSYPFLIFLAISIVMEVILNRTVWGLQVRATGSDRETARDTEVPVNRINILCFMLLGALSGVAGILSMARISSGDPALGIGWEFTAIAGCVLGGVSLFGYTGSMAGMFLGMLLMQTINNGIVILGVSPYLQVVVVGAFMIVSMAAEMRREIIFQRQEK